MKYTNIKKLLIKFMGGGLINFPTRFLRYVKINGYLMLTYIVFAVTKR